MTIPLNNWCSTCQEGCHDHSSICTVCGSTLEAPPSSIRNSHNTTTSTRSSAATATAAADAFRFVPEFLTEEIRQASREFRDVLLPNNNNNNININDNNNNNNRNGEQAGDEWQQIPSELLQPDSSTVRDQPTSRSYLAKLPRFLLEEKSSIFRRATLEISSKSNRKSNSKSKSGTDDDGRKKFQLVPGEFGPSHDLNLSECQFVVANPRTGKGGLSEETKQEIQKGTIVYMERGDGIPFVQKAILAQECGAAAVVVGNSMSEPWPYVMQDSKGDAETLGLSIPVAMAKIEDGKTIVEQCGGENRETFGNFRFQQLSRDCAICCESLQISQKILQIPSCGHIFHEKCALLWLTKHHTCPYCRYQLPTEDKDGNQVVRHVGDRSLEWGRFYG
jgi:hypothetical protein